MYFAYKGAQARAAFLSKTQGWDAERLKEDFWKPHHTWYSPSEELTSFQIELLHFNSFA